MHTESAAVFYFSTPGMQAFLREGGGMVDDTCQGFTSLLSECAREDIAINLVARILYRASLCRAAEQDPPRSGRPLPRLCHPSTSDVR